ncbi:MAG: glycine betaine/L-proline ABC transporter substrate-binding protein ProX [Cyanobacteria bacterium J06592_8]
MLQTKRVPQKSILLSLLFSLLVGLIACQPSSQTSTESTTSSSGEMPGTGVKVRSSSDTTTEGLFMTEIVNIGLEKLGYETEAIKQLSIPLAHTAVSNGDLELYGPHWQKLQTQFFEKSGGDQKLERVGLLVKNVLQGYKIDQKTAEQYNISTIDQLKDPEIAKLFDSDGDGKANLTGCNAGWGCELVIEHQLDAYELRDTVEHDQGEYDTLLANTVVRYQQGKPILYYAYVPHWSASVFKPDQDTIWLEVPFTSLPKAQGNVTEKETSFEGKNRGFAIDNIRILTNKNFLEANPAAQRLFELMSISIEDVNAQQKLVQNGENRPEDIRRHAEEWVQKNQQKFDSWVETAKQAVQ